MDQSQNEKAQRTATELMRISVKNTGTIEELVLIEAAKFILTQTDLVKKLQNELDELHIKYSRHTHIK